MAAKSIEFKVGNLIICLDWAEAITCSGVGGAMYYVCVSTPDNVTWQCPKIFVGNRESTAKLMASEKMEKLINNITHVYSRYA